MLSWYAIFGSLKRYCLGISHLSTRLAGGNIPLAKELIKSS